MAIQNQWKIGGFLAASILMSGCSNQPDYCEGIKPQDMMDNLYYIKDNSLKVKSAKMIRGLTQICRKNSKKGNEANNADTQFKACFKEKLVGCGFSDKVVQALAEK